MIAEIILRALIIDDKAPKPAHLPHPSQSEEGPTNHVDEGQIEERETVKDRCHPTARADGDTAETVCNDSSNAETQPLLQRSRVKRPTFVVLLLSSRFGVTLLSSFILNGLANGFDAILPAYSHDEFGASSFQISVFLLLIGVPMFLAPVAGYLSDKYGPRWPIIASLMVMVPSLFLLRYVSHGLSHAYWVLGSLLGLIGVAYSQCMLPLQVELLAAVESVEKATPGIFGNKGAHGQAFGLLNATFASGAMLGPLVTGSVRVAFGLQGTTLVMAILACLILLLVILRVGETPLGCRKANQSSV